MEATPEVAPEVQPEVTPEVTPEVITPVDTPIAPTGDDQYRTNNGSVVSDDYLLQ